MAQSVPKGIPWTHFEKVFRFVKQKSVKNFEVVCLLCPEGASTISCGYSSAANLKSHLQRKHKWDDAKFQEELHTQYAKKRKVVHAHFLEQEKITQNDVYEAVDNLVIYKGLSFNIVDSVHFKHAVELGLSENITVGCRQSLTARMDERYKRMTDVLKTTLANVSYVATTADCWTKFRRSYLGMTLHWIDDITTERKSAALALKRITGRHTADVLAATIHSIHTEFGLQDKVRHCTTDSAANIRKAFRVHFNTSDIDDTDSEGEQSDETQTYDESEDVNFVDVDELLSEEDICTESGIMLPPHQRCASHILNLIAMNDAPKALKSKLKQMYDVTLKKLRVWWRYQNKSSVVADVIKECLGVFLIIPAKTRWNSEYDAIAQICSIIDKTPEKLHTAVDKGGLSKLNPQEIVFLQEYAWVTQPVAYPLNLLQKEKFMYIGFLLPTMICFIVFLVCMLVCKISIYDYY